MRVAGPGGRAEAVSIQMPVVSDQVTLPGTCRVRGGHQHRPVRVLLEGKGLAGATRSARVARVLDGEEQVIAYMIESLEDSKWWYCTTRKELLAMVKALKQFQYYENRSTTVLYQKT